MSTCTLKINKLRRKNRALLDQLESNSALLECRLKKLKHTAKTEKHSDKSWENLPPSPLKRKFESWKARNYSGQVSAVLQRDLCDCTQNSSVTVDAEVELKENMEESPITSPVKRTRHNVLIVSNPRKKSSPKPHRKLRSQLKSTTKVNDSNKHVKCSACHHIKLIYENDRASSSSPPCDCNYSDFRSPKRYSGEKDKVCINKKTLEAAKSMLNYSPESQFLRRLKKRSQTLENLLSPGNIRKSPKVFPAYAKSMETISDKITETRQGRISPKKSSPVKCIYFDEPSVEDGKVTAGSSRPTTAKSPVRDLRSKRTTKSPSRDIKNRPTTSKSTLRDFYNTSPPRDVPSRLITAKSPVLGDQSGISPVVETRSTRKTRKRVCYKKNCYCRVQQRKLKPRKKIVEDFKENLTEEDSLKKDVSSSEEVTSPHGCHCCCHCDLRWKSSPPKALLLMTDTISSSVDNELQDKYIRGQCRDSDKGSRWFNKINEFRQSHYFDCHAHPHPSSLSLDSARNWDTTSGQPLSHKCVHKYSVDDRFFAKPLYSDHQNNSRCTICHQPLGVAKMRKDGLLPITLPSKLDDTIIEVSVPLGKCKTKSPKNSHKKIVHAVSQGKTNNARVKSGLASRTIGNFKALMPPPADSLALRYQKGVIK